MSSDEDNIPFGPIIPPNLLTARSPSHDSSSVTDYDQKDRVFGPAIPKNLTQLLSQTNNERGSMSPGTPDVRSDTIGPLPEGFEIMEELRHSRPDEERPRSKQSKTKGLQREKWMTELPDTGLLPHLGLTARQFRSSASKSQKEITESRRAWTSVDGKVEETPQTEAEKRQLMMEELAVSESRKRDELLREVSELNQAQSHREKTLLQIHHEKLVKKSKRKEKKKQKKHKKRLKSSRHKSKSKRSKKKKAHRKYSSSSSSSTSSTSGSSESSLSSPSDIEDGPTRVPFDREKDLRINVLTNAQRKGIIARSQNLNGRFGSGAQQFL